MNLLLTGSRVYGTPRPDSDLDAVALVDGAALGALIHAADESGSDIPEEGSWSLRFGRLNLIATVDPYTLDTWREGTASLKARRPVSREKAVRLFAALRADIDEWATPRGAPRLEVEAVRPTGVFGPREARAAVAVAVGDIPLLLEASDCALCGADSTALRFGRLTLVRKSD